MAACDVGGGGWGDTNCGDVSRHVTLLLASHLSLSVSSLGYLLKTLSKFAIHSKSTSPFVLCGIVIVSFIMIYRQHYK